MRQLSLTSCREGLRTYSETVTLVVYCNDVRIELTVPLDVSCLQYLRTHTSLYYSRTRRHLTVIAESIIKVLPLSNGVPVTGLIILGISERFRVRLRVLPGSEPSTLRWKGAPLEDDVHLIVARSIIKCLQD